MRGLAIVLAACLLAGCPAPRNLKDGAPVAEPTQWTRYCAEHPERNECR
jgi:hypothetical protein